MTTESTAQTTSESTAQTVLDTVSTTLMASLPTIVEALAVSNPQDAIIAAAAIVIAQDVTQAIKDQVSGKITSSQLLAKFQAAGPAMTATSDAWKAYAASVGEPETPAPTA